MQRILPTPRRGLLGAWDRFVGPGMTQGELRLVLSASVMAAVLAGLHVGGLGMGWPLALVAAVIAFDVIGGAVCNATDTTKRWYHRPGTRAKDHFSFIALHILHIFLVAALFRGSGVDWGYFLAISAWLLISAALVIRVPEMLKSPVAVLLYLAGLATTLYGVGLTPGLEWFVPALFLKLLVGHAVPLQKL